MSEKVGVQGDRIRRSRDVRERFWSSENRSLTVAARKIEFLGLQNRSDAEEGAHAFA